jgi:hypothetical protein
MKRNTERRQRLGRSTAAAECEMDRRIRQLERTLDKDVSADRNPEKMKSRSELRRGSLLYAKAGGAGLHGRAGGPDAGEELVELLLQEETARYSGRPHLRRADRRGPVTAAEDRFTGESETCPAGDARTRVTGVFAAPSACRRKQWDV